MGRNVSFENRDTLIQFGITISSFRKMQNISQERLAEKAGISRSLLSMIEAPGVPYDFSLNALLNITKALNIELSDLVAAVKLNENVMSKNQ